MGKVGIVIPTIFGRPQYLPLAIKSIREAGSCHLALSAPNVDTAYNSTQKHLFPIGIDQLIEEPVEASLPMKITHALNALPEECVYIGWLGDDDLLKPDALTRASEYLDKNPDCVMVYGGCDYIDKDGSLLFTNHSSQFASQLLNFGPQLIPQPGALWRRDAFEKIGGLSSDFNLAFDFDLFLKLKQQGALQYLGETLASFRWHRDSLSVKKRWVSVSEASRVRRSHYKGLAKSFFWLWEPGVIFSTWIAGKLASVRIRKI